MQDTVKLSDVAFTASVKAEQERHGSRRAYEKMDFRSGARSLEPFLAEVDTAYLATATKDGQPYAQHRGGRPGFIKVIDDETIGFADFEGNRQYVTTGNLAENDRAFHFLMDYAHRRRVKIWGRARMTEDPEVVSRLIDPSYPASAERALIFTVTAFDINCPQHIPQKLDAQLVMKAIAARDARIEALEAELSALRGAPAPAGGAGAA
jgi:predicted pyridoxine 5'-phosphate oxidase superfamily flavin-nucleotide-binding protein